MPDPAADVHEALDGYLEDDEITVRWVVVMEVASLDGSHFLAHRAGGGSDGSDAPMAWAALGMLRSGARLAEDQVVNQSKPIEEDDT